MMVNHFLITSQLSRVITTHTFVPVRCIVIIESAYSKVKHAVIQTLITKNIFISLSFLKRIPDGPPPGTGKGGDRR